MKRWLSAIALDTSPLRESRDYRLLWLGQLVSMSGSQLRFVAVPYQVYLITRSPLAVGLIGAFQAGPLIALSLWGGVVADAVDRRRLLLVTQTGLAAVSVSLALATQLGVATLPLLYGLTAVGAALTALDGPARQAMIPSLVGRKRIPAAMALNQVLFQVSIVLGPAVGGFIIAALGLGAAYWLDALTYGAAMVAVGAMRSPGRVSGGTRAGFAALVEGLRFLRRQPILLSTMGLDFAAMFFGWPRALLPFFADRVFDTGPQGLGLLFAAPGMGALLGALSAGWITKVRRQGAAVLAAVTGWGLAIAGFGLLAKSLVVGVVLLGAAGLADVISAIFRGTILQTVVPDELRGRLNSVNLMVVITGPRLGEVESGVLAALVSPHFSIVFGGFACLAAVAAATVFVPSLARYQAPVVEERMELLAGEGSSAQGSVADGSGAP